MSISALQREGFAAAQSFHNQVNGIVVEYALYLNNQNPNQEAASRNLLARVIQSPQGYAFPQTIVADSTWALTYDAWAADPPAADGAINGGVQAIFGLLTGWTAPE